MLHRATDAEREVELGCHHDAGGADLALVAHPSAVGDHARRPHAGAEMGAQVGQLGELFRGAQAGTATDDADGFGEVDGGSVWRQHLHHTGVGECTSVRLGQVDGERPHRAFTAARLAAPNADLQRCDQAARRWHRVHRPASIARHHDRTFGHQRDRREERSIECRSQPGPEVAAVGRRREHDDRFVGEDAGQGIGPRPRSVCAGLAQQHVAREVRRSQFDLLADEQGSVAALVGGLQRSRGQCAISNGDHAQHAVRLEGRGRTRATRPSGL